jgi:DNA polymerase bacteriophage-type
MHVAKDILWLDFETRSRVNLKTHGAYRYVECPDHRILIASYALGMGKPKAAILPPGGALPVDLQNMLADKRLQIRAHNAAFDRLQLKGRAPPIERWYCTAAQARAVALPGKLEDLGRATKQDLRKDPRGQDLIKLLSIPQKDGRFNADPKLMREFADYGASDIYTMRACSLAMPEMRQEDLEAYWAGERINDRGLPIDTELCALATQYAAAAAEDAADAVIELSDGALRTVRGPKLTEWVYERLDPVLRKHMETIRVRKEHMVIKGAGVGGGGAGGKARQVRGFENDARTAHGLTLAADIRTALLDIAADNPDAIDPTVVQMIEAAEAGSMSSVAKFRTMLDRVGADGRLRGAFVFNGAYQTNRWSSTGAQVHNFPRLVAADPEAVLKRMRQGRRLNGVLLTLKGMLRPAIAPKDGKVIVRADWNAVEARALPWLADNAGAREYMAVFNDPSRDIYVEQAQAAGLGPLRQPGKVVVLSMGYGGGVGALSKMAKNYNEKIAQPGEVVTRWRKANPWAADKQTGWWHSLARCAMSTMDGGPLSKAGRVSFAMRGDDLTMTLPSGRVVWYPQAEVVDGMFGPEIGYLKASWKPKAGALDWPTARLWHGILAENADQAVCADLLREAIVRAEKDGIEVIGHVHDEIITEASPSRAKAQGTKLQRCMLTVPKWAAGLPLKVETDISPRFRK